MSCDAASEEIARLTRELERLRAIASIERSDSGAALLSDRSFRRKLAELEIDVAALTSGEVRGDDAGLQTLILAAQGADLRQRLRELALEAIGQYAAPCRVRGSNLVVGPAYAAEVAAEYFAGGEAAPPDDPRDIIAERVLGLRRPITDGNENL